MSLDVFEKLATSGGGQSRSEQYASYVCSPGEALLAAVADGVTWTAEHG